MAEPRTFASLSSSLLARKGHAKPAMRPHGYGLPNGYDDLGWNDMGQHDRMPTHPQLAEADENAVQTVPPAVVLQQAGIAEELGAIIEGELAPAPVTEPVVVNEPVEESVVPLMATKRRSNAPVEKAPVEKATPVLVEECAPVVVLPRARAGTKAKAAFTLRLDPERHLRLRLASAITHRSAQVIVTEALDALLGAMPEIETLAARSMANGER